MADTDRRPRGHVIGIKGTATGRGTFFWLPVGAATDGGGTAQSSNGVSSCPRYLQTGLAGFWFTCFPGRMACPVLSSSSLPGWISLKLSRTVIRNIVFFHSSVIRYLVFFHLYNRIKLTDKALGAISNHRLN